MKRPRGSRAGERAFTLVELMIVIAIIATIAAIAIPGLLTSLRAANERNASSSLKTLASAEADFKTNDREDNKVQDYWTNDVAGLYCMTSVAIPGDLDPPIKLIEISIAGADSRPMSSWGWTATGQYRPIGNFTTQSPKAGYWFYSLYWTYLYPSAVYLRESTGGSWPGMGGIMHRSNFAFMAYPDRYKASGKVTFMINDMGGLIKRDYGYSLRGSSANPPLLPLVTQYPSDVEVRTSWGKLD